MIRRLIVVMTWAGLFGAGFFQHGVQAQAIPSFASAGATRAPFTLEAFFPHWNGSGLVGCENNRSPGPVVYVIAADGTRDNVKLSPGDSTYMTHVFGAAVRSDRAVTVIGMAQSSDSRGATFVSFISPHRPEQTYIRLNPYSPRGGYLRSGWNYLDRRLGGDR